MTNDQRRGLRVKLRSYSQLATADGTCHAHLLNLSEHGALVAVLAPHQLAPDEAVTLDIELPDGGCLRMEGRVAHVKEHMVGLDCAPATEADARKLDAAIQAASE